MSTQAIDQEIALEQGKLAEAQAAATAAAEQLAKDPGSKKHRLVVMQAQQTVAEIQVGIDALNAARIQAAKHDAVEEAQIAKAKRTEQVGYVLKAHEAAVEATKELDVCFSNLRDALGNWLEKRKAVDKASRTYLLGCALDRDRQTDRMEILAATSNVSTAAFARCVGDVIDAAHLTQLDAYVQFFDNALVTTLGMVEVAERRAGRARESLELWESES